MSSKASNAWPATSTSRPKGAAARTRWLPPRTRLATNGAQSSAGRIWSMCRHWANEFGGALSMKAHRATATSETAPYGRSAKSQLVAYSRVLACVWLRRHSATAKQYCPSSSAVARHFGIRRRRQIPPISRCRPAGCLRKPCVRLLTRTPDPKTIPLEFRHISGYMTGIKSRRLEKDLWLASPSARRPVRTVVARPRPSKRCPLGHSHTGRGHWDERARARRNPPWYRAETAERSRAGRIARSMVFANADQTRGARPADRRAGRGSLGAPRNSQSVAFDRRPAGGDCQSARPDICDPQHRGHCRDRRAAA